MRVKNHHMPPTILVDRALGISSDPAGVTEQGSDGVGTKGKARRDLVWGGCAFVTSRLWIHP